MLTASAVPAEHEHELVERSGGNPFYLEELLRLLIQRGALAQTATGWAPGPTPFKLDLPDTVEAVVMSRFDRLSDGARRVGRLAAVVDRPFEVDFLDALAQTDTSDAIDTLVTSGLLDRDGSTLRFHHDLAQDAIYSSLLPSQREQLHARTADRIAEIDPDNRGALAHHYDRSTNQWPPSVTCTLPPTRRTGHMRWIPPLSSPIGHSTALTISMERPRCGTRGC